MWKCEHMQILTDKGWNEFTNALGEWTSIGDESEFCLCKNEHIVVMVQWYGYSPVEPRGVSLSHSKPRKFSNLDLIRPAVCQSWTELIQTAAALTQQSISTETEPSPEKNTGSPIECSLTWTTPTAENGNHCMKTTDDFRCLKTHRKQMWRQHKHRNPRLDKNTHHYWVHCVKDIICSYHCHWSNRWPFPASAIASHCIS